MHTPHIYNMYLQILLYIHIYMRERRKNCAPPTYILLKYIVIIYYNYTKIKKLNELKAKHKSIKKLREIEVKN